MAVAINNASDEAPGPPPLRTYVIRCSGKRPVHINGNRLLHARSDTPYPLEIGVFETAEGEFVTSIAYCRRPNADRMTWTVSRFGNLEEAVGHLAKFDPSRSFGTLLSDICQMEIGQLEQSGKSLKAAVENYRSQFTHMLQGLFSIDPKN